MKTTLLLLTVFILACNNAPVNPYNPPNNNDSQMKNDPLNPDTSAAIPNVEPEVNNDNGADQSASYSQWEDGGNGVRIRRNYEMEKTVAGTSYVNYSSYSSGSSGGTSSESKVQLCSDMTISAYEQSSVSVYVEGADGSSSSEDSDEGTWEFWEDDKGNQYLKVNLKKTGQAFMVYRREGNKVRLGNSLYHVTQAGC